MSAFQRNKFQPVWRCIEKDMAVLILVVGASRKSETISLKLLTHSLSPQSMGCTIFLHAGQLLHTCAALLQSSWQHLQRAETLQDSSMGSTFHQAKTAPAFGQQHLQHSSTPDSNLQHFAAPAAPWTAAHARPATPLQAISL
jgi:hypothetical protein